MLKYTIIIAVLHLITLNFITVRAQGVQPTCPPNYVLINGLCYFQGQIPAQRCPEGYYLSNNLCYRTNPLPCDGSPTTQTPPTQVPPTQAPSTQAPPTQEIETTTEREEATTETQETTTEAQETTTETPETTTEPVETTTETVETTTEVQDTTTETIPIETTTWWLPEVEAETTMESIPEPAPITTCPIGSILIADGVCRKVYCTQGEYYEGRCLQPVCPDGTVWRFNSCQPPSYTTTILEIDNVFHNEINKRPGLVVQDNKNNVYYHNSTTAPPPPHTIEETTTIKSWITQRPPVKPPKPTKRTTTTPSSVTETNPQDCCSIVTPRICKRYGAKWVCFNRRYRRCDPFVCQYPIIYLKTPKIVYEPPVLIMPPNPPLHACATPGCDEGDTVDCTGCAQNIRETCSTYCYRYMCPSNACAFMDQQKYCNLYPGEPGCTKQDGCLWDWCGENC